jgi:ribosomal protein S18 acetylase RimI-like enzyme
MIEIRPFRNADPPVIVELWRACSGAQWIYEPVSCELFEQFIFGRLYFDYDGLLIAFDGLRPIGFVHTGFGPNETFDAIEYDLGAICQLRVRSDLENDNLTTAEVAEQLLERAEAYLRGRGAKVIYGGAIRPLDGFYLGLYGGSELPGVVHDDLVVFELFSNHKNYRPSSDTVVFRGDLRVLQIPMTRQLIQTRRRMRVDTIVDPVERNWWDVSVRGDLRMSRYELRTKAGDGDPIGYAMIREMDLADAISTVRRVGLTELWIDPEHRRQGLVTFLLSEVFHQLIRAGIAQVDVQTMAENSAGVGLYEKLGFDEIDRGTVFRRQ